MVPANSRAQYLEQLIEINRRLGVVCGQLEGIAQRLTTQDTRLNSHAADIGSLKRSRSWLSGATVVLGVLVSMIAKMMGLNGGQS